MIAGSRSTTGKPIVASDPHIAFAAVSCWYDDGRWEPARERSETIAVRGSEPITRAIRHSRNGPIVDELLPESMRAAGPVSLRWLGADRCGWLTSLLAMDRATSVAGLRRAVRGWRVPTWSLVLADADGHIGYQVAGEIPVRAVEERGYRPGWDPAHQWHGVIPSEDMPQLGDPERGWIASANNRTAPEDFPWSLSGRWASGYRARRIRQMLEASKRHSRDDCARMHLDVLSLRAATWARCSTAAACRCAATGPRSATPASIPTGGAAIGANYRMIADFGAEAPGLWVIDAQGQSGHPGSPHHCDQLAEWLAGRYHFLPLDRSTAARQAVSTLRLTPRT